jgi:hypothetical protein
VHVQCSAFCLCQPADLRLEVSLLGAKQTAGALSHDGQRAAVLHIHVGAAEGRCHSEKAFQGRGRECRSTCRSQEHL